MQIHTTQGWLGSELQDGSEWIHELDGAQRAELAAAARELRGRPLESVRADSSALPVLGPVLAGWRRELERGRGFVLVRGVPRDGLDADDLARLYWLMGSHLGQPVAQNAAGEKLCHVRDTGADPRDPATRLYATSAEQDFHTDGADIIGLLCLQPSKSGGLSRIVSSVAVHDEIVRRRPDLAPLLYQDWPFALHGYAAAGLPDHFRHPICRVQDGRLSTFYIGWYIRRAASLPGVTLSAQQLELLELFEAVANQPGRYLDMSFQPGDIQWLKNAAILHKRTAYEDFVEPERKRHLLRLWLSAPDFTDGSELLRGGVR